MKESSIEYVGLDTVLEAVEGYFVVTDENLATYWPQIEGKARLAIAPGESSKTWKTAGQILEWLAENGAKRGDTVVALGGGMVGDLAGFAASVYMRGVKLIQIPTSLLAMVDSSVGGKTGVDLDGGKNLAGAFYPADRVLICDEFLKTLPTDHWENGAAEIWKYGAIMDPELFAQLEAEPISPNNPHIAKIVETCVNHKLDVVRDDPYERTGRRAILNFGHSIGHAIEWAMNYQGILHGQAVAIGMVAEQVLAEKLEFSDSATTQRIKLGLESQNLPTEIPSGLSVEELIQAMRRDKKVGPAGLAFSLVSSLGTCKLVQNVPEETVAEVLKDLCRP